MDRVTRYMVVFDNLFELEGIKAENNRERGLYDFRKHCFVILTGYPSFRDSGPDEFLHCDSSVEGMRYKTFTTTNKIEALMAKKEYVKCREPLGVAMVVEAGRPMV